MIKARHKRDTMTPINRGLNNDKLISNYTFESLEFVARIVVESNPK